MWLKGTSGQVIWERAHGFYEEGLGGSGGYNFEGGGGERLSLCGEGGRVGDGRIGWEVG